MKQSVIYALDFDGVLCDSAIETGVSGWKAANKIWEDFTTPLPSREMLELFRQARPIMGTGYEAIIIVRLLKDGLTVEQIMDDFSNKKQKVMDDFKLQVDQLKKLFGETRDNWIHDDLADWVGMNPLFSGISEKLKRLSEQGEWYIVTTKQERFVKQILMANHVELADHNIYGLDRNRSKAEILIDLVKKHQQQQVYFVEDMLPALKKVIDNGQLGAVKLFLASWGYNTEKDRLAANSFGVKLIDRENFLTE